MIIITLPIDVDTDGFKYKILFRTMSTEEEHPLAPGSRVVAGRSVCSEIRQFNLVVSILGDRIAVYVAALDEKWDPYWSLHAWSWHQGGQADQDIGVLGEGHELLDVRFLTKEKLLTLSSDGHIELYNVEDLSKAPRLQARFILPVHRKLGAFRYPSVFHSAASCARLTAPDDHWMWTTNPADRVISVMWGFPLSAFVISARIFFLDIPPAWFDATSEDRLSVPWSSWGPQNSRYFDEEMLGRNGAPSFGVGGSRVIRAVPTAGPNDSSFRLHMTDFNPSAVARGIGKVVREPTTLSGHRPDMEVTTYLPFVEVVHDHVFDVSLWNIILDEERMLLLTQPRTESEWKMKADLFDM
ncbi:hypothetical protein DFH29DRAFT_406880 [Suillus ampliporus]|nr:hypothetical protein DFH29DRAFT_406880 [Suillus ampliporus]